MDEPFSHFYVENVFPDDIYARMMEQLPEPAHYTPLSAKNYHNAAGQSTRDVLSLDAERLAGLPTEQRELWEAIAGALVAPELKVMVFRKLATDLSARFGVPARGGGPDPGVTPKPRCSATWKATRFRPIRTAGPRSSRCSSTCRPTGRQLELGTAVYKRRFHSLKGLYSWHGRFEKVKQFVFPPNSGYAFAVSNSWHKKSWHGRETLPAGSGVRNTLLTIYFADKSRSY